MRFKHLNNIYVSRNWGSHLYKFLKRVDHRFFILQSTVRGVVTWESFDFHQPANLLCDMTTELAYRATSKCSEAHVLIYFMPLHLSVCDYCYYPANVGLHGNAQLCGIRGRFGKKCIVVGWWVEWHPRSAAMSVHASSQSLLFISYEQHPMGKSKDWPFAGVVNSNVGNL